MDVVLLLPVVVTVGGAYLLFKLRFFCFLHPIRTARALFSSLNDSSSRRSLALALAGTLGVGNIVGVAVGILIGGAGSVFWLLVSAPFAIILKYSESTVAADYSDGEHGSMPLVLGKSFDRLGGLLSLVYAILCLILSFVMGAALQSASAVECAEEIIGLDKKILAVFFTFLVILGVVGGIKKIEKITAIVIPVSTIVYIFLAVVTILCNLPKLPSVLSLIVRDAFSFRSAVGGVGAFCFVSKLREGYARGILSNEAGAGTSSMAHSRSAAAPCRVGLCGICEVIFDTLILCTLTALAILVCSPDLKSYSHGVALISDTVGSVLGCASSVLLLLCILVFAYSTVICWYYYGVECWKFIFNSKGYVFFLFYIVSVFVGCVAPLHSFVYMSDFILLCLCFISVSAVIKNSDRVLHLSEKDGLITPRP